VEELECGFAERTFIGRTSITRGSDGEVKGFRYERVGRMRFGVGENLPTEEFGCVRERF
jgi:hypothetical protein